MWMGGFAPLSYDLRDRMLVINRDEAESVRSIFRRYLELWFRLQIEGRARGQAHHQ
jgi:site-specific DNA recombinase